MSKRKMLLKELDDAVEFVENKLHNEKDKESDNYLLYLRQLKALQEINTFVSTYDWMGKGEGVKEKIKFIRDSQYDYELVRKELNLSADALKSLVARANKKLAEKIGSDSIDLIISRKDTVSFGLIQFRICSGKYSLQNILISDFYGELPKAKIDFFNIYDCKEEIETVYKYSVFGMKEELEKCNLKKLAFLRYILENSTDRYKEEQKDLISLFQGVNIDLETYLEKLSNLRVEKSYGAEYLSQRVYENDNSDEDSIDKDILNEDSLDVNIPDEDSFEGLYSFRDNDSFFEESLSDNKDFDDFVPLMDDFEGFEMDIQSESSNQNSLLYSLEEDVLEDL